MRYLFPKCIVIAVLVSPAAAQVVPELIPTAEQMRIHLSKRPEEDVIHWKDPARRALQVRVIQASAQGVSLQKTLASRLVSRVVPISDLSGVVYTHSPVEQRLVVNPVASAVPALQVLWNARAVTLGMEKSNVSDVGIALAKALRLRNDGEAFAKADSLLSEILSKEKADHRLRAAKAEVETLSLARALVSGPPEDTDKLAWKITESSDHSEAMLMATAWLADRHFADLKRLEEEHPRWEEDDEVRPLRMRLYHLSLDFALYPSLFQGTYEAEAAAGLKKAWEVYRYTKSAEPAVQVLEDLAELYPDSRPAMDTAAELARIKAQQAAGKEPAAEEETPEAGEQFNEEDGPQGLPNIPPAPKRYNLFDD